jgi:hypothetical protein
MSHSMLKEVFRLKRIIHHYHLEKVDSQPKSIILPLNLIQICSMDF